MAEPYLRRGLENPAIIDLITHDKERDEVVLVMIERRPWNLGRMQLEQLNDKLNAYFTYVLDGHLLDQYPQYLGMPVRLRLDSVEEPNAEARGMLRAATRLADEQGLSLLLRRVSAEEIPQAPWETAGEEASRAADSPPSTDFRYRREVLQALESFGVRPRPETAPERVRAYLNALYVFEIRELRARRSEAERFFGPQPMEPYSEGVAALREKYALLSLPLERWAQDSPE